MKKCCYLRELSLYRETLNGVIFFYPEMIKLQVALYFERNRKPENVTV